MSTYGHNSNDSFSLSSAPMGGGLITSPRPLPRSPLRVPPRYSPTLLPGRLDSLYKDLEDFYYTPIDETLKGLVPPPAVPDVSVYRLCRRVYKEKAISALLDPWENIEDEKDLFDTLVTDICLNSVAWTESQDPLLIVTTVSMDRDLFQASTIFLMHFLHLKRPTYRIRCGLWMLTAITASIRRISNHFPELLQIAKAWSNENLLYVTVALHDHLATTADAKYFDKTGHAFYRNREVEHRGTELAANGVLTGRAITVTRAGDAEGSENFQVTREGHDKPFMDIARDFVNNPAAKGSSIAKDMAKLANEHLTEVLPVPISPTQVEIDHKLRAMKCRMDVKLQLKEGRSRRGYTQMKKRKTYQPTLAALPFDTKPTWLATRRNPEIKDADVSPAPLPLEDSSDGT
ncbi:hypothetical protein Pmar_PMAR009513 [Perkinsus marinus ATCC 50983]|uniref:Uncharacterized protein n=1 Tax=Perkinsus marinus (strain ATCC 50983 / TXsc) TaxID=423536 RepID=C5KEE1_PERM5|nr:hypothetical protein Pmar_PMAR009513 [Perkinsus marinus ATCC 50983]EER17079.1 hypothetical protein Pmar_PMAR009513 [Perkinsus marinus ATCC 50983]|eukprot:XP_002785283.1 hypothetical protein Pmar_PMAR009513 [Perkinsus marinus ATCC 50983]